MTDAAGGRLGMFGGAFDPPHIGHLIVARDVTERLGLDRLLVVPTARPPHREAVFAAEDRLRMVRAACAGEPRFEVVDAEYRRPGPSYTVDTLEWIRETRRPRSLYVVMGADQFRHFPTWHRHERILDLAEVAVMTRAGDATPRGVAGLPYVTVDVTRVDLSGTGIRRRLAEGRSIRYLVPDGILGVVEELWTRKHSTHDAGGRTEETSPAAAGRPGG